MVVNQGYELMSNVGPISRLLEVRITSVAQHNVSLRPTHALRVPNLPRSLATKQPTMTTCLSCYSDLQDGWQLAERLKIALNSTAYTTTNHT